MEGMGALPSIAEEDAPLDIAACLIIFVKIYHPMILSKSCHAGSLFNIWMDGTEVDLLAFSKGCLWGRVSWVIQNILLLQSFLDERVWLPQQLLRTIYGCAIMASDK